MKDRERILISENAAEAWSDINNTRELAFVINKQLIPAMEALGVKPTLPLIMDSLKRDRQAVEREYREALRNDLKGIKVPAIKEKFLSEAEIPLQAFEKVARECSEKWGVRSALGFKDGKCYLTPEGQEAIRERFRYYISGPQIEVHKKHLEAVDALNRFLEEYPRPKTDFVNFFRVMSDGSIGPNPKTIYWEVGEKTNCKDCKEQVNNKENGI